MSKRHLGCADDFYNIVDLVANRSMSKLPNLDLANAYIAIVEGEKNFESGGKSRRRNYVIRLRFLLEAMEDRFATRGERP